MALTRKLLKSLSLEEAQIETIIDAHTETVDGLKESLKAVQTEAAKVEGLTQQLNEANDKLSKAGDAAKVQKAFDDYKAQVEAEKKTAKTAVDVQELLKEAGISRESFRTAVAKSFDAAKIAYADDGSISNRAELVQGIKTDFADFVATTTSAGTPPVAPPSGNPGSMTKEEILAIKDTTKRQAAIRDNLELFRK